MERVQLSLLDPIFREVQEPTMIYRSIILFVLLIMLTGATGFTEEQSAPGMESHIGTVIEIQKTEHYIYLLLDVEDNELWISTFTKYLPKDIAAGDKVEYAGGLLIQGFNSLSMNKSFEKMLLISKIRVVGADPMSDSSTTK